MAEVGDRVEVKSKSGARTGVVIRVNGSLLTLRWDNGEETTLVPAPGVLSVVAGGATRGARRRGGAATATKSKMSPPAKPKAKSKSKGGKKR